VAPGHTLDTITLAEIATRSPICAKPDWHAFDAVDKMRSSAVSRLPVVEHGRVTGIVSIGDLALKLEDRTTLAAVFAGQHANDDA
jgi:CBS domain-containing protein